MALPFHTVRHSYRRRATELRKAVATRRTRYRFALREIFGFHACVACALGDDERQVDARAFRLCDSGIVLVSCSNSPHPFTSPRQSLAMKVSCGPVQLVFPSTVKFYRITNHHALRDSNISSTPAANAMQTFKSHTSSTNQTTGRW